MLHGILPIVLIPFDENGEIDEPGLRRVVQFELQGAINGIGVNGFASEAYKLTDDERRRTIEIVAHEVGSRLPFFIGLAPGSTEAAVQQIKEFARYNPAAYMVLPPATMKMQASQLVEHYVRLGQASDVAIMVQQSPHIQAYSATGLSAQELAEIADRAPNVQYFKIEGPGSPDRIAQLRPLIDESRVRLFGGGGGITFLDELNAGASGLIPGVGFNDHFVRAWDAYTNGDHDEFKRIIEEVQTLVEAVSGYGHEFSLHARKFLLKRKGVIDCDYVRFPTVDAPPDKLNEAAHIADSLGVRISV